MVFVSVALHALWAHKFALSYALAEGGLGKTEFGSCVGLAFAAARRIMGVIRKPGATPPQQPKGEVR